MPVLNLVSEEAFVGQIDNSPTILSELSPICRSSTRVEDGRSRSMSILERIESYYERGF